MTKLFLISSTEGATEYYFSKKQIEDIYKKYGREDEIIVKETRYRGHLEEIVRSFLASSYKDKLIICLGGDGTINEVVNICLGHDVAVGLIPTGTGNDFAKNFDYENFKIADTFDISIRPIDLIKVNGKYCVNVTSLGFDTEVLKTAYDYLDKDKSLGKRAYIKAVGDRVKNLTYQDLYINLTLANDTTIDLSDEFLISAICNGGYYGSGFNPAPDAKIDDGIINFVTARKFPKWQLLPLILKYKQGKHQSSKYLDEYLIKSGQIKSAKDFLSNIDGEIFSTNSLDFEIKVNAINWAYFEK